MNKFKFARDCRESIFRALETLIHSLIHSLETIIHAFSQRKKLLMSKFGETFQGQFFRRMLPE